MQTKINVGDEAKDRITGFHGIVVARTEWLNKCVRISIQPRELREGKPIEAQTFDEEQVEVTKPAVVTTTKVRQTGGPTPEPARRRDVR